MRIGLIDVDGHNFPSLPLMKLSAWHKQQGDEVEFYEPLFSEPMDCVYMSKVFTFTEDYAYYIDTERVVRGGTGYHYPDGGEALPSEIEHIYPDYSLYPYYTLDTAYGFLSRGCPRGCGFCIVGEKEGKCSQKVADLQEFWRDQKKIVLLDPNITACSDWEDLFGQLIESEALIDFSQGLDIRLMDEKKTDLLMKMHIKQVHFAWDNYKDKEKILPKFREFKRQTNWDKRKMGVYVLTNFNTTLDEDLDRIYTLRELGFWPYVMIYEKEKLPKGHILFSLQRWVNNRAVFESVPDFSNYTNHRRLFE